LIVVVHFPVFAFCFALISVSICVHQWLNFSFVALFCCLSAGLPWCFKLGSSLELGSSDLEFAAVSIRGCQSLFLRTFVVHPQFFLGVWSLDVWI
jgi:hypothetical protein